MRCLEKKTKDREVWTNRQTDILADSLTDRDRQEKKPPYAWRDAKLKLCSCLNALDIKFDHLKHKKSLFWHFFHYLCSIWGPKHPFLCLTEDLEI